MSYLDSIKCLNCDKLYDETRKPCLGTCNHSICLVCKNNLSEPKCPICGEQNAFREEKINRLAIEARQMMTANIKTAEDVMELAEQLEKTAIKDLASGPCSVCQSDTRELRLCTACADPALLEFYLGAWTVISETLDDKAPFLKLKSAGICSDCILDGHHEDHQTVPMRSLVARFPLRKNENECTLKALAMMNNSEEAQKNPKWRFVYLIEASFLLTEFHRAQLEEYGDSETKSMMALLFSGQTNPNILSLHRQQLELMDQAQAYYSRMEHRFVDLFKMVIDKAKRELQGTTSEECREIAEWIRKMEDATDKIRLNEIENAEEKFRKIDAEVRKGETNLDLEKLTEELVSRAKEEPQEVEDPLHELQKTRPRNYVEEFLRQDSELEQEYETMFQAFVEYCECCVEKLGEFISSIHCLLVALQRIIDNLEQTDIRVVMSLDDPMFEVNLKQLWDQSSKVFLMFVNNK